MGIHSFFNVSQMRKWVGKDKPEVELGPNLSFEQRTIVIVDRRIKELKNNVISLIIVSWDSHSLCKSTWKLEDDIWKSYPCLVQCYPDAYLNSLIFYQCFFIYLIVIFLPIFKF